MAKVKIQDLLKQGIEDGDWSIICSLYKAITGQEIEVPTKTKPKNLFIDDGKTVKRTSKVEKKLYNEPNLAARRPPAQLVEVRCSCGAIDELPSNLAMAYTGGDGSQYKCQRCVIRQKRN